VHLGLLEGTTTNVSGRSLYVWFDPEYPAREAAPSDLLGLEERVANELQEFGSPLRARLADTPELLQVLRSQPRAMVAIIGGGTLPDPLFGGPTPLLRSWVESGGTLFWAGTPLGYYDGNETWNGSLSNEDLGWEGQERLLGFPLEDPIGDPSKEAAGPLYSDTPSPLGAALGISYEGTADGANVSQVEAAGGTDLGFIAATPSDPSASERTSLAYLPLGEGGIYYFGGGIWTTGLGSIPDADLTLSDDLALLAGIGFVPGGALGTSANVLVENDQTVQVTVQLPGPRMPVVALVESEVSGNILAFRAIAYPAPHGAMAAV
jgi:hypothetical protein